MSEGTLDRDLGGIQGVVIGEPNWETRANMYRVLAEKRLAEIDRQDAEIADLRRQVAALRAVAK